MSRIQICLALVLVCALFSIAAAQESTSAKTTLTITANANGDRVRVTAPSSVVQMHVEVYAASGEKLFDQEIRGGNVFDWHVQNGQAQRLPAGDYVCVVTAKTISGKLTQKIGAVTVAENSASVRPGHPQQLSLPQTQAIGPVEENSSWTIVAGVDNQTPTVIANDGSDGQMIRGRGALTFRIGNFFSGIDTEQMRLTEAGDLGIGTSTPQSKLDVAGAIRAERFLVVKPKLAAGDKTTTGTATTDASDSVQPLIAGTGTQNQISKWIDNAGTLGDSGITENGNNLGLGTTTPGAPLEAYKAAGANANGGGVLVSRYNDGAGTFRGGAIYSRFISAANYDALIFGVTSTGARNPYADFDQARMAILANGNVGIGTTTPGALLEAYKPAGANATGGGLLVSRYNDGAGTFRGGAIYSRYISAAGDDALVFGVTSSGTKNPYNDFDQARMAILASGNVGIGTTAPAEKLTVQTAKGFYGFTHLATDPNGTNPIAVSTYVGGSASGATGGWFGTQTNHDLHFFTNGGQPSMTIIASGNVGIGTSTPTNKLHVENTGSGSVAVYGNVTNSGTGVWGNNTNNGTGVYGTSGNGIGIAGESNGIGVRGKSTSGYAGYFEGKVYVGGSLEVFGNICAANFMCQSDARLKQAVAELHYGLSEVLRLRPVRWDWKDQAQRQLNFGLIAQDVEKVLPELVTTANDAEQTKGLIYIGLLPVVIKAIQEQQAALEQKETTLKSLKAENTALQQRNTELDARLTAVEQALQQLLNQQAQAQPGKREQ